MKKALSIIFFTALLSLFMVTTVFSQTNELTLKMSRDWGYGGFNEDIQGLFSMKVTGPSDLVKVVFYIDNAPIGEITQAPYNLQFNTDQYSIGKHELYAIGYSSSGQVYQSNVITSNFVPASEGNKVTLQIVVPVLVIVFGAILLSFLIPLIQGRGKTQELPLGAERSYRTGGGICTKCHRPFAIPFFSMNLGFSKLARCPYCGKWSVVRLQPLAKLREAEQAELERGSVEAKEEKEEDRIKKGLDDSKYQDL
jgi:DNA-directed RNA polymerase subunit RPC12/RpoP